jgi:outer membrane murein-binding lipoprotein Lpp
VILELAARRDVSGSIGLELDGIWIAGYLRSGSRKRSKIMPVWIRTYARFLIAVALVISFCLIEGDAQTRRKKRTRRTKPAVARPVITNPPVAPPEGTAETGDVKIISTADSAQEPGQATSPKKAPGTPEQEEQQQTITTLSNQVKKLTDKLTQMQDDDRYQLDMERLTRAEQRAEQLSSQLIETQSKIADFESRLEQLDFALKPENIERATQGYGTTHPEEARDARRRQLESERSRVQAQLRLVESSKTRLETAVANADTEVDQLRMKLNQRREQMDAAPVPSPTTTPQPKKPE